MACWYGFHILYPGRRILQDQRASRRIHRLIARANSRTRLHGYLLCLGGDGGGMSEDARGGWGGDYRRPGAACRWAWPWPDTLSEPLCPRPGWQSAGMDDVSGLTYSHGGGRRDV